MKYNMLLKIVNGSNNRRVKTITLKTDNCHKFMVLSAIELRYTYNIPYFAKV